MPQLTVLNGQFRGKVAMLGATVCRIGRDVGVELPISDAKASRVHVEITLKDGRYVLRDLKSKNGTLVNGTAVTALTLREGDQIQIGETRIAFSLQEAPHPPSGRDHDSMLAPLVPVGAVPGTGGAGVTEGGERFETLELTAPLQLLSERAPTPEQRLDHVSSDDRDMTPYTPQKVFVPKSPDAAAELARTTRALRALFMLARMAAEATSSAEMLGALVAGLRAALEADRVTAVTLDEKGGWAVAPQNVAQLASPTLAFSKIPVSRTIVDYALRTRRSVLTAPLSDARFGGAKSIGEQGIRSALCVPIISHEEVLGLIYADRLGGEDFGRDDQEFLTAACLQVAPALVNLRRLEAALTRKARLVRELKSQHNLLGESPPMREVEAFIERAAPTQSVVLILGESGTGKELVARAIHYSSKRSDQPLVVVNCAALTESLIESELFGHARGAFTGATADRPGRFEMAHEGTIFLDEIGELSNACQTKLLRVLEQGELSRVGEGRVRKVDVRVLAATNRDLQAEVKAGRFREDLYYRLNVLSISLPPLRERADDVLLLLNHYLREAAVRGGRARLGFSEDALALLRGYRWPGNVRELRNLTERLAVLCPNEIVGIPDLPPEFRTADILAESDAAPKESAPTELVPTSAAPAAGAAQTLADVEKGHILRTLAACENNKKLAAERLGIDRSTLYAKLRAYGLA